LNWLFSVTLPLYSGIATCSKTANRCPLSEICVHGIGFTNSPDTVANENLDRGKEAGPIAEGCDKVLEDIERYKETHI
jgi:hypothetical protein